MRSHLPAAMLASGIHQDNDGHALHQPVLVLNASYEPINVCAPPRHRARAERRAMTEEENGHFLHAARVAMRVPSVIRLLEYRRIPHQSRALSGRTFCCATGNHLPVLQHSSTLWRTDSGPRNSALARSLSTWENLVAAASLQPAAKAISFPMKRT